MKWIDTQDVQHLNKQIDLVAHANGTADTVLARLESGWPVLCVITKYAGATEAEDDTRVMAPVLSRDREYNREVDPETGEIYGWQEVGDFLTFHESKAGNWRYNTVCLTRHAEDPEDCRRSQRLDRIGAIMVRRDGSAFHRADSLTVRNRI
tara:strand:- start:67 stop:519 length:453 start_codon:yes stop_codon:yes gene_type:complete